MTKPELPFIENVIEDILKKEEKKLGFKIDIKIEIEKILKECRRCFLCQKEVSTKMSMFSPDKKTIYFYGYGDVCIEKYGLVKMVGLVEKKLLEKK